MHVGEVGVALNVGSNVDLTGYTPTLILLDSGGNRTVLTMTVGAAPITFDDGSVFATNFWAYRNTLAGDFVTAGIYQAQFRITNVAGQDYVADLPTISVSPRL